MLTRIIVSSTDSSTAVDDEVCQLYERYQAAESDAEPYGHMLVSRNTDEPGVIGFIGRVFGEHDVNIASMANAREKIDGEALTVYNLDDPITDAVIEALLADDRIVSVTSIDLQ